MGVMSLWVPGVNLAPRFHAEEGCYSIKMEREEGAEGSGSYGDKGRRR